MVIDRFNMVDMEGVDLIESQGVTIPGLYQKLVESIAQCRYTVLYNWQFDKILIPPTPVELTVENQEVKINEEIYVTSSDIIVISSVEPPLPIIQSLSVTENGTYIVPEGVDGYNPVIVSVPADEPSLQALSVTENGNYLPDTGYDGFSSVIVNVPTDEPSLQVLSVTENGNYLPDTGYDGFSSVSVNVPSGVLSPILYWDFTNSVVDEIAGVSAVLAGGATRSSEGVLLAGASSLISLGNLIYPSGRIIEIEMGDCEIGVTGTNHARFIMATSEAGLIYRSNSVWSFYSSTNGWSSNSNISDADFFSNSTIKVEIDINGYWKIYKDNVLVYSPSVPQRTGYIVIGASSTSFYQAYIKSLKVY